MGFVAWSCLSSIFKGTVQELPTHRVLLAVCRQGGQAAGWRQLQDVPLLMRQPIQLARHRADAALPASNTAATNLMFACVRLNVEEKQ